jgi:hypothetical protein
MVAGQQQYVLGVGQVVDIPFPLKILQAWTVPNGGGGKQELWPNAIDVFNRLPTTNATGTPSQFVYQPFINFGWLNLWPIPDATTVANRTLTISYMSPFEIFSGSTDTPYFPREWNNALIYGLVDLLAPEYGVPLNDRGMYKKEAETHLNTALDFGLEHASLRFMPLESYSHAHSG